MSTQEQDPEPEKLSKYWVPEHNPLRGREVRDVVEEQIQQAMAKGEFKNLPGKGKPMDLGGEHPWEERDWMSNHILSNAKVLPEWMELDRQIRAELDWLKANRKTHQERAERTAGLNRLIDRFNFVVPLGTLQRVRYRE